jgi:hypothetical protein
MLYTLNFLLNNIKQSIPHQEEVNRQKQGILWKEKSPLAKGFFICPGRKPNFVLDNHLSRMRVATHLKRLILASQGNSKFHAPSSKRIHLDLGIWFLGLPCEARIRSCTEVRI